MLEHEKPLQEHNFDPDIGGAAGEGTYRGAGGTRPEGMPTKDECDWVVAKADELVDAIQRPDVSIYIEDDIDLRGVQNVKMGDNVTLVGGYCDPDVPGRGPVLKQDYYPRHNFITRGVTEWYGVSFHGPTTAYFDPRNRTQEEGWNVSGPEDWYTSGIFAYPAKDEGKVKFVGCEFAGWTLAGIECGARGYRTEIDIHRCTFRDSIMETLGYGVEAYRGDLWMDKCYFDRVRHAVSGFGYGDQTIDVTNSVGGPSKLASHLLDMHGLANNLDTDSKVAGEHLRVRNCTMMATRDVLGYDQEGIAIRGHPTEVSWWDKCHFFHPKKPDPTGDQGDAYRQESYTGEWERVDPRDNIFGESFKEGYGAPRITSLAAEDDTDTETGDASGESSVPMDSLTMHGRGFATSYSIVVAGGKPTRTDSPENDDKVTKVKDGVYRIHGSIVGFIDQFEITPDSTLIGAWVDGPIEVTRKENPVDLAPLVAAEATQRINKLENELAQVEKQTDALAGKLDNAHIVYKR